MIRQPEPHRMAIHQAGHAVAQALVGRERFSVSRVSLETEVNPGWPQRLAIGEACLDRKTDLTLYEFGLVTLAGIAAEERYMADLPPEEEPLVALSDLKEWQEQAWKAFADPGKVELISLNIMRKLHDWFAAPIIWGVVEELAEMLLDQQVLETPDLSPLLARLP